MSLKNSWKRLWERVCDLTGWKIIDSYILRKFLGSVVYSILLLMTIIIVFDLSENIQRFMSKSIPVGEIITGYYFNFIPYFINLFIPLFTFISVIWFTSKLSSHNEIISILDNGVSFKRFLVPYFVGAVVIMLVSLFMANFVVPYTNEKLNEFKYTYFGKQAISTTDLHIKNSPNSYLYVQRWDRENEIGYDFTYEEFENSSIRVKVKAMSASYDTQKGKWVLRNFVRREIVNDKEVVTAGKEMDTVFNVLPRNFSQDVFIAETMSYKELRAFIKEEKLRGSNLVAHFQIMTFLGLSVSSRKNQRGVGVHIFMGMGLAFTFIFLQQVSTVFSVSGGLPPVLGTWIPNIIFLFVTILTLKTAQK